MKIDKYTIAADIKRSDPVMSHKEALELAKIAEKIYLKNNCTVDEAIELSKELLSREVVNHG